MTLNSISLVGTVAKRPELERTRGGTAVCRVVLVVDRPRSKGDITDWIRCQAYGKTAEWLAQWQDKGSRLWVTGSLCCDQWEDREGQRHHMWYVLIDRAGFAERKRREPVATAYQGLDGVEYEDLTGEEVPF